MAMLTGSSTAEIDAPLEQVWALVEDVERAPEWQGGLKGMHALERDDEGHAILCQTESDAKVRTIKSTVRFTYNGPTILAWRQEKGELKSVEGRWELEDLGGNRTRATYSLEVDLGRMLSLVIRGPLVDLLRGMLVNARAGELKRAIESGLGGDVVSACGWSLANMPITTIRTGPTGRCSRSRPQDACIHRAAWPVCAFCAGTG